MAGGIGPPQDSERRALVGTSSKNPPKDEASLYELRFVPVQWWACRSRASRVFDELASLALDTAPGTRRRKCGQKSLDRADDVIDGAESCCGLRLKCSS